MEIKFTKSDKKSSKVDEINDANGETKEAVIGTPAAAESAEYTAEGAPKKEALSQKISGVFSCESESSVGTGTTTRKSLTKSYWFAEQVEGEGEPVVMVQPLNSNKIPAGPKESVVLSDFLDRYEPEIEYYQKEVFPMIRDLDKTLKRAESQRDLGALYSAEHEFGAALDFDEENVRANFGLGLTYMERGEPAKARDVFTRVVGLDAAFTPEHKHLFNEFGINLRKSKLTDQAVDYYRRALELTDDDENLYYNIARPILTVVISKTPSRIWKKR